MLDFAHVCAVKSDRIAAVVLVSVHIRLILVALLRLYVLYQVESNALSIVRPVVVFGGRLRSSHVQWPIAAVVVVIYAVACEPVPFFLSHFLFVLSHQFPFRKVLLVLLVVEHFAARVDLLNAKLGWCLVVVVCDVNIVVVVVGHTHARRVGIAVDDRRLRLDVMPYVRPVLVDDVVGMLKVTRRRLSHMARIVELLLLLLKLQSLLLLLLAVLRGIIVFFAFSFTLPFLVVGGALAMAAGR